ncbi:MAG TPA: hypothetical protein VF938_10195 [Candidatus Angelobacter sp.]
MKILLSGRRTNTLQDIRAAVAATKQTEGKAKTPERVTIEDMKTGIARAIRRKYGRR